MIQQTRHNVHIPDWIISLIEQCLTTVGALLVAFLTPLSFALWFTVGLVLVDTITGVMKAGQKDVSNISSKVGFNKTLPKLIVYFLLIVLSGLLNIGCAYFKQPQIFVNLTLLGIAWIEIRSVDENFKTMFGFSFIEKVLEALKFIKEYKRK
jgi:phage-related holin